MARQLVAVFTSLTGNPGLAADVQRFRKRVFVDQRGWDLRVEGDREVDEFDNDHAVYCAVLSGGEVVACFRAIRSDMPYLGQVVFPALASTRPWPRRRDMWEITRFGISEAAASGLAELNYGLMFHFGLSRGASSLLAVGDLVYERYLRSLSIHTRRFGPPQVIGQDRRGRPLRAVAGEIPMRSNSHGMAQLLSNLVSIEVIDETLVLGSAAVSA